MVRLAVRKTPSKSSRYSTAQKSAPKKSAVKKTAAKKTQQPIFVPKIKMVMNNLEQVIQNRKKVHGPSDGVAKRLSAIHQSLGKEMRKSNVLNTNLAKTLKKVNPSIRGIKNIPKTIGTGTTQLMKFLKQFARKDVIQFLNNMKRTIAPMETELKHLEQQLNNQVKGARTKKIQLKVDPSLYRRFNTLNNQFKKCRTQWLKGLNSINLHGTKEVKSAINQTKRQIEQLQRGIGRNLTILKRYTKASKAPKGFRVQQLISASQAKQHETRFSRINSELNHFRISMERFCEHLKATKLF